MDVKQSNPKAFEELDLKLKQLGGFEGKVGWFESAKYPDGTPVAYVAAIQELGHGPIPPRPFMRVAQKKNQEAWKKVAEQAAKNILDGKMTGQEGMELIAMQAEADVLEAITAVNAPPLSPITLWARLYRRKGIRITGKTIGEIAARIASGELSSAGPDGISKKPLNDSGFMIATLTHVVEST